MTYYILQVVVFQALFLLVYDLFLRRETFYTYNRIYLLLSSSLALVLPFMKVEQLKTTMPQQLIVQLPEVVLGASQIESQSVVPENATEIVNGVGFAWSWEILLYLGMVFAALVFCFKLIGLSRLIVTNTITKLGKFNIVSLKNCNDAFSFFRYIFIGNEIKDEQRHFIVEHEKIHAKQLHSIDLLYLEILKILFWFNPLVYIYQNRTRELHEFIADSKSGKTNKSKYYEDLLNQVFGTKGVPFVNSFYRKSLLKKRIVMLNRNNSNRKKLVKYAMVLPLIFGILLYVSCEEQPASNEEIKSIDQLSYTMIKGEPLVGELQKSHEAYRDFLINNPAYVGHTRFNEESGEAHYSIVPKEKVLDDVAREMEIVVSNGKSYKTYTTLEKPTKGHVKMKLENADSELFHMLTQPDKSKPSDKMDTTVYIEAKPETSSKDKENDNVELIEEQSTPRNLAMASLNELEEVATIKILEQEIEVPYAVIDQVPLFKGCDPNASKEVQKKCTANSIADFVNKNFNMKLAQSLGLDGRQRIQTIFRIDAQGNTTKVRVRAKHPKLEEEVRRVIALFPKFIPGEHNGKKVIVPYSLPVIYANDF